MAKVSELVRASVINAQDATLRPLTDTKITSWDSKANLNSPVFTGSPTLQTTPATSDETTKIASTAYVKSKIVDYITNTIIVLKDGTTATTQLKTDTSTKVATTSHVKLVVADYAPLTSAVLITPTLSAAPLDTDDSLKIACTSYVQNKIDTLRAEVISAPTTTILSIIKTSSYVVSSSEMGKNFTNNGALAAIEFTLPLASSVEDQIIHFTKCNANTVTVKSSGSDKIMDGIRIDSNVSSETIATLTLHAVKTDISTYRWVIRSGLGTWITS